VSSEEDLETFLSKLTYKRLSFGLCILLQPIGCVVLISVASNFT